MPHAAAARLPRRGGRRAGGGDSPRAAARQRAQPNCRARNSSLSQTSPQFLPASSRVITRWKGSAQSLQMAEAPLSTGCAQTVQAGRSSRPTLNSAPAPLSSPAGLLTRAVLPGPIVAAASRRRRTVAIVAAAQTRARRSRSSDSRTIRRAGPTPAGPGGSAPSITASRRSDSRRPISGPGGTPSARSAAASSGEAAAGHSSIARRASSPARPRHSAAAARSTASSCPRSSEAAALSARSARPSRARRARSAAPPRRARRSSRVSAQARGSADTTGGGAVRPVSAQKPAAGVSASAISPKAATRRGGGDQPGSRAAGTPSATARASAAGAAGSSSSRRQASPKRAPLSARSCGSAVPRPRARAGRETRLQPGRVAAGPDDARRVVAEGAVVQDADQPALQVAAPPERIEQAARRGPQSPSAIALTLKSRRARSSPIAAGRTTGSAPGRG